MSETAEIAEMYNEALQRSFALIDQLSLIQKRFPSSTNADRIRMLQRFHTELVQAHQDRCRELRLAEASEEPQWDWDHPLTLRDDSEKGGTAG